MSTNLTPSSLRVIRLALLAGVLLLGGVVWYLGRQGSLPVDGAGFPAGPWMFIAVCVAATIGILFVRAAQGRAPTFERRALLAIAGWALGEGVALFGGIYWLVSGRPTLYLAGLAIFLVALTTISAGETSAE
jgi:hypothetical protein